MIILTFLVDINKEILLQFILQKDREKNKFLRLLDSHIRPFII